MVAIGTKHAAELYGLAVLETGREDHDGKTTRFALVARPEWGIPAPTGHDKTTIVCFQSSDHPGSLAHDPGAVRRPQLEPHQARVVPLCEKALGEYCFVIDIEGHVADEVVSDCLRDLHATLPEIKFLGSYPAAGEDGKLAPPGRH